MLRKVFDVPGDLGKPLMALVKSHGFAVERHLIRTEDAYINCAFRVNAVDAAAAHLKPVVLMQHGLNDSASFALNDGRDSLAFHFARAGFDVWLSNSRGNRYSRLHEHLDPDDGAGAEPFWDFSFHEMGTKDLPALYRYVQDLTGQERVTYLGHSQGCSSVFANLCETQGTGIVGESTNLFLLMGPAARIDHSPVGKLARVAKLAPYARGLLQEPAELSLLASLIGSKTGLDKAILRLIADRDPSKCSEKAIPVMAAHANAGTSVKSVLHYQQMFDASRFQKFDYGAVRNIEVYGQATPPEYDLRSFSGKPIALLCGKDDLMVSQQDYKWLSKELEAEGNLAFFGEYDLGHQGLATPANKQHFDDMLDLLSRSRAHGQLPKPSPL